MGCRFIFNTNADPLALYNWAITEASTYNVNYSGTQSDGSFSFNFMGGTFNGKYSVIGKKIEIYISKKPIIVPCGLIEAFLKKHIT
ncbi:hypothetical protein [uncultured Mucilaginibacter sp.]|uniref:hypothetical protein n=1 Tax=uncultured Mucilaginibacter sp. TaxID=797541 RepID=UPI0025D8CD98|nr:hypothetical protein [uncultured Mucilaginibacter sp.]